MKHIKEEEYIKEEERLTVYDMDYHLGCSSWPNCEEGYCELLEVGVQGNYELFDEIEERWLNKLIAKEGLYIKDEYGLYIKAED